MIVWLTWPWFLRRQAEARARSRPDVPVDLALREANVTVAVPGTWIRYTWSSVQAVLECRDHVGLLLPLSAVLVIPKRALDEDRLAELRQLLTRCTAQPKV
ncbi:YcxB family protein [Methylobacterium indicum]|uniref:YcxB family protein n=1 Tax=Methylobacterium indicum TaxID=1775910 RepID=UPI0024361129|nr:YcxB family protein [Methylobacterium indicum]